MFYKSKAFRAIRLSTAAALLGGVSLVQGADLEVFPQSGVLLDNSIFELTFISAAPADFIDRLTIRIDGVRMEKLSQMCSEQGKTTDGRVYARCKGIDGSAFGPGIISLDIDALVYPGGIQNANVQYEILETEDAFVKQMILSTNSSERVELEPNYRYAVHATGQSILWPENPNFNISSPAGNGTTCLDSYCPLRGAPTGALVYRVPGRPWQLLGPVGSFEHSYPGEVEFRVNDRDLRDNIGSYEITITRSSM